VINITIKLFIKYLKNNQNTKKLKNSFLFSNLFIYLFIILIILIKFDFEIIILKFNLVYPKKKLKKKYQKKLIILIISIYSNIN